MGRRKAEKSEDFSKIRDEVVLTPDFSKSVCAQAHEGSNPSLSAKARRDAKRRSVFALLRLVERTLLLRSKIGFAFEPKAVWELAHKRLGEKSSYLLANMNTSLSNIFDPNLTLAKQMRLALSRKPSGSSLTSGSAKNLRSARNEQSEYLTLSSFLDKHCFCGYKCYIKLEVIC